MIFHSRKKRVNPFKIGEKKIYTVFASFFLIPKNVVKFTFCKNSPKNKLILKIFILLSPVCPDKSIKIFILSFFILKTSIHTKFEAQLFRTEMDLMEGVSVPENLLKELKNTSVIDGMPIPNHPWIKQ